MVISSCRRCRLVGGCTGSVHLSPSTRTRSRESTGRQGRSSRSAARPLLDEADEVALGVDDEGHPLVGARRPERVVVVAEDDVRLAAHLDPGRAQPLDRGVDVVDPQVVQGARRARVEEQPHAAEVEEDESRRVVGRERLCAEEVA